MRIFVLGAGGTGSFLARLLARQGHTVWCGDRDLERARRFLGKKSAMEIREANARNLWSIVRAGQGAHLIVNASPAVFNRIACGRITWISIRTWLATRSSPSNSNFTSASWRRTAWR